MIVYYMRGKHGHSCAGATHMTKVFVKRTILFLQCAYTLALSRNSWLFNRQSVYILIIKTSRAFTVACTSVGLGYVPDKVR